MEAVFLQVLWVSLTVSAVLLPLLLAKGWLRRRVRAKALYVVWLLLALRLAVPVDLSLPEPPVEVEAPELSVALTVPAPGMTVDGESPWAGQDTRPQTEEYWAESPRVPVTVVLSALWLICDLVWAGLLARVWGDGKGPVLGVLLGIAVAFTEWTEALPILIWPIGNLALAVLCALVPKGAEEIVAEES